MRRMRESLRTVHPGMLSILIVATVVRIALIPAMPLTLDSGTDPWDYNRMALSLAHGHGYPESYYSTLQGNHGGPTAARPPLYPLMLAAAYVASGDKVTAARLLQAVVGGIAVVLLALCAGLLWDRRRALITGLLGAIYVPFIVIGTTLMSEALLLPLFLALLAATIMAQRTPTLARWPMVTGALVGLTVLTHANSIILLLPAALAVWPRPLRANWRRPLTCCATCVLLLVPWTIRNLSVMHRFIPLTTELGPLAAGTYNTQAAVDPENPYSWRPAIFVPSYQRLFEQYRGRLNEVELEPKLLSQTKQYILHHPTQVPKTVVWNFLRLAELQPGWSRISSRLIDVPSSTLTLMRRVAFFLVALMAVGAMVVFRVRLPWVIWLPSLLMILSLLPFNSEFRFRLPLDPVLLLLSAAGIDAMLSSRADRAKVLSSSDRHDRHSPRFQASDL